jgi:hypothetical protein
VKAKSIACIGLVVLVLVLAAGLVFLANAHVTPPTQKVEQSIPDDHIPH